MQGLKNLWSLLRPRHWVKNGFVFLGLLFANAWHQPEMIERVLLAAVSFSLVASGVYAFNDLFDREQDRNDPKKKTRPLASGAMTATTAIAVSLLCWGAGQVADAITILDEAEKRARAETDNSGKPHHRHHRLVAAEALGDERP